MRWWPRQGRPRIPLGTYGPPLLRRTLWLPLEEAKTHVHVIGKSGSGKSRWLVGWLRALIHAGQSVVFLDPHGDTARFLLGYLVADGFFDRPEAFERLLYLDIPAAARQERYLPLNWLDQPKRKPHKLGSHVKEAFHRCWPELSFGAPMFDTLVQDGVKVLISNRLPLTALYRLLTDQAFRSRLLAREDDPDIVAFFHGQFDRLKPHDQVDQAGAALRRAHLLTYHPELKHSLGQPALLLSFREILDRGQSVVINLAVEDEDTKRLLGCLLTVFAEQGALSRAELPPGERFGTTFLAIDEFSSFSAQSAEALGTMLSQTRKYGLFATLAHQNWTQATAKLQGALQNCGLEVTFKTGRDDAERSARIVGTVDPLDRKHEVANEQALERTHPVYYSLPEQWERWVQRLVGLERGQAYVKDPRDRVVKIASPWLPEPSVDRDRLAAVEEHYLRTCFRPVLLARDPTGPRDSRPLLGDGPPDISQRVRQRRVFRRGLAD